MALNVLADLDSDRIFSPKSLSQRQRPAGHKSPALLVLLATQSGFFFRKGFGNFHWEGDGEATWVLWGWGLLFEKRIQRVPPGRVSGSDMEGC